MQNPTKKQVRKGKSALIKLFFALKDYSTSVNSLLECCQPSFKYNIIYFANIYKHACEMKVNSYEIIEHKLLDDPIFELKVKFNYSMRLPAYEKEGFRKELKDIAFEYNIRVVPELLDGSIDIRGDYKPSIIFITECYVNALNEYSKRNKEN